MSEGERTFAGFGFGAIMAGLFLYEASRTGLFSRYVVAEIDPRMVEAIRHAGGYFHVNIASASGIGDARIGPIEILDPAEAGDRARMIEAIAAADELATAIPSVAHYGGDRPGAINRLLAAGFERKIAEGGPRAVLYAAENHNHAAEILAEAVAHAATDAGVAGFAERLAPRVQYLNTVIGKMSGVIRDPEAIARHRLATVTPELPVAFLVEEFNRILVSRVRLAAGGDPYRRCIAAFEEKDDLLPFEEAKLYGHNATHALAAYLAVALGIEQITGMAARPELMRFLREAFLEESGAALIRRHAGVDRLFTEEGWREYADDLLARMTNPWLLDSAERVGRDPQRKLGWSDRLIGTMRIALGAGIEPVRFAVGAAAAVARLEPALMDPDNKFDPAPVLDPIWAAENPDRTERARVLELIAGGRERLRELLGRTA